MKKVAKKPRMSRTVEDSLVALLEISNEVPELSCSSIAPLLEFARNTAIWRSFDLMSGDAARNDEEEELFSALRQWMGAALRDTRLSASLTQSALCQILKIQRRTLRKYETGERYPTLPRLVAWCLACDAAPWTIFVGLEKVFEGERRELSRKRGSARLRAASKK